jgi:hypothetical protein
MEKWKVRLDYLSQSWAPSALCRCSHLHSAARPGWAFRSAMGGVMAATAWRAGHVLYGHACPLLSSGHSIMRRLAAVFLLLSLTGTPIAAAACIGVCGRAPEAQASRAACHDTPAAVEGFALSGSHSCDAPLLDTPFLASPVTRAPSDTVQQEAPFDRVADMPPATGAGRVRPGAHPLAPPSPTQPLSVVLRI